MTPDQWRQVKEVLHACLETPPDRRAGMLAAACAGQPEIRTEVESLLLAHEDAGAFLETPVFEPEPEPRELCSPGDRLGIYQIIQQIGEGGMGVVYQAVRDDAQFRKLVAIKVVKRGMDTAYILRRFHNERQILAHFDHPNIARVLDGGATPDGRPYVVMEFIAGEPVDVYCQHQHLALGARLALFLKICSAVDYAHRNLVVHRDLKPRNILVTPEGEPKLLDFGIAKLLSDERDFTVAGTCLMTPEYASPEQVRGAPITTASDVYSLGVLLYELLTGQLPYPFRGRLPGEIADTICQAAPLKPSTAVRRAAEHTAQPKKLRRQLIGDLDSIVLMALRKEPELRYASVEQFSADIRRHLEGLPVQARKGSMLYHSRRFVRRHRAGVLAAGLVLASLLGGLVVSAWQVHVARRERARAERRFQDVRRLANSMLFELHDAIVPLPGSTKARELLVRKAQEYLDNLAQESVGDPSLERERALAYQKIGDVLGWPSQPNLGKTEPALASYRKSQAILEELRRMDPGRLDLQRDLANGAERICSLQQALGQFKESLVECGKSLELRQAIVQLHPGDRVAHAEVADAWQALAVPYFALGDWHRSQDCRNRALALFDQLHKADPSNETYHFGLALAYLRMANLEEQVKQYPPALAHAEHSVALLEELSAARPGDARARLNTTFALQRLGSVRISLDDLPGALQAFRRVLPIRERILALDSMDARARVNLANSHEAVGYVLLRLDQPEEALAHFREQLRLSKALVESDPARVENQIALATSYENVGSVWAHYARHATVADEQVRHWRTARPHFARSLEICTSLRSRGALAAEHAQVPPRLQKAIAECDRGLRRNP